jgi:hypothetical protein
LLATVVIVTVLPRALLWNRLDTAGCELAVFDDRRGLTARGSAQAASPVAYSCRYELFTDADWASVRFDVSAEGAGWLRTVRMERAAGRWRITTAEQGNLDASLRAAGHAPAPFPGAEEPERLRDALDVDLYNSPLTNTLPIRRLGLVRAGPGTARTITAAWVLLPSLAVVPLEQSYAVLDAGRIRYSSGNFTADLDVDDDGFVRRYPGLAVADQGP